jgi:penicillin amidase
MSTLLPLLRRIPHPLGAALASAALLALLAFGVGPVPALGGMLDPGHGVWSSATEGVLPHSQTLRLAGLTNPVSVSYTAQGVPSIQAADETDAYLTQGYVTAANRLTEMDLDRREGEGRLAQLVGSGAVSSDQFELRIGLLRTAQEEWAAISPSSAVGQELLAYSRGVNDYIAQLRASGDWPATFTLEGVYPAPWTPVDSLGLQGVLTQALDFTTEPLDYSLLVKSLGTAKTMAWFPVEAANAQYPYDPGPYRYQGITPIAADAASSAGTLPGLSAGGVPASGQAAAARSARPNSAGTAEAASTLLSEISKLPAGQVHEYPDSNSWAANGPKVAGGGAMLAGDPHLPQTLPSIWYQVALGAPGFTVSGVSMPGLPGIIIGHNAHIAWSLTDVQNQSTLFYDEQTSPDHPDEYFWKGSWRPMRQVHYTIDVHGGPAISLTVDITVHGPIMTQAGQTMAVDWMGNIPSSDLEVMNTISKASDFTQFRSALANWKAPTQNFVYADDAGNIGAISAGYYPQVAHGQPYLPLSGTGADDVTGVIPYAAIPQAYDPPGHMVATANQRPVSSSYPYYIGTSGDFFDPGYRAGTIDAYLSARSGMTMADFATLQLSRSDLLASTIVPKLLAALGGDPQLSAAERAAERQLAAWNDQMDQSSAAASIWNTFWTDYIAAVFQPWWRAAKVPTAKDSQGLSPNWEQFSLDEDLQEWTLSGQDNPAFTPPGGSPRTAVTVMRQAFRTATLQLQSQLGTNPATWSWGRLHSIQIPSLSGANALGYGPEPAGGDSWVVNAADGYPVSSDGPSWRMIVSWTGVGSPTAAGIYPGGQSENPASPWYSDLIADWWNGRYLAMPPAGGSASGQIKWQLSPEVNAHG